MKHLYLLFAIILCTFLHGQTIQEPDISIPILVYDNSGNENSSRLLYCGIDSFATDSIDSFLGEYWLYCPWDFPGFETDCIPYDHFEAVLDPPIDSPYDFFFGTWKDFRFGEMPYSGIKTYRICCGAYQAASAVYILWDFPEGVSGVLQDGLDGLIFTYQMPDSGSFTHPALMQLGRWGVKLILTFQNVTPVELTSFTAFPQNNTVTLNWQTATETNNSGFQIERRKTTNEKNEEWYSVGFVSGNGTTTELKSYSFVDENLSSGIYNYRLKQIDYDGTSNYSNQIEVEITPLEFALEQNYPNPFNPSTKISWQSPVSSWQTIKIYNSLGQEVETIVNEYLESGAHSKMYIVNSTLPSGIYFYQLKAGENIQTKKMVVMK